MTVLSLKLRNFRNYAAQEAVFSKNLNFLYGDNAQGKTNILEAIFLCSTGRSHRTQKDVEMIRFGEKAAVVELELERKDYGIFNIKIEIAHNGRKSILINDVPQRRAGDLLGRLNCVVFSPEDLSVVQDEPQVRRRFLDMFISQIKPSYYFNLHRYLGVLRQRNSLLRQARDDFGLLDTMAAWDGPLSELGAKVMRERLSFVEKISDYAYCNHSSITGGLEQFIIKYDPSLKIKIPDRECDKNNVDSRVYRNEANRLYSVENEERMRRFEEEAGRLFLKTLEQGVQSDLARMSTQYGPHKDDVACLLDGVNIRLYGSQGQQRTAALALKMAQVDVMTDETGDTPVLLLDDVMSELDRQRQDNLSLNMKNAQTFMTGTERHIIMNKDGDCHKITKKGGDVEPHALFYRVENGRMEIDNVT